MKKYDHTKIEKKWQKQWEKDGLYETKDSVRGKKNYYALVEFPYPSGNTHIGHWYAFAVPDIFARFKRMQGNNMLFPIGFDAFGLPAENAAIKNKLDPKKWTYGNIARMREQLKSTGASFDWSREIVTSDPDYYKWTQWLFLQLYKKGLAYRGKAVVNWDPKDKTVLANEQVLPDGTAERSGATVEKRELTQWFLKITDYAERLLKDLEGLSWPEEIKQAQRAWIGKSEGALIKFPISNFQFSIEVFTTRPDTLFGATYLVISPETLQEKLRENNELRIENYEEVARYIEQAKRKKELERISEEREKTGVELKGIKAINPATKEEIPIFVADYVLGGYGTGAIMAVPAHDDRDLEFAMRHNLSVRQVVAPQTHADRTPVPRKRLRGTAQKDAEVAYTGEGFLIHSGKFDGMKSEEAKDKITEFVGGIKKTTYKLRDWLISRQRYWGCPIPIVYDPEGNAHPVPEEHLPWLLPTDVDFTPTGEPPLASSEELKKRTEKLFGVGWRPEVDTLDTFIDSSWYYIAYTIRENLKSQAPISKQIHSKEIQNKIKQWLPVKKYSGGAEHTTVHLLYSRFFHKALFDLGIVAEKEPYETRMNRGIILGTDGRKMSKRWGNVIDPDEQVKLVGADSVRMYLAFIGPYNTVGHYPWDTGGIVGTRRFLERVFTLREKINTESATITPELETLMHQTIKKVSEDIEDFKFNTAVSALMIYVNALYKVSAFPRKAYENLLLLLAPFAPHITEELWSMIGQKSSIHLESWPVYSEDKTKDTTMTIVVQVNGKVRDEFVVQRDTEEEEIKKMAQELDKVLRFVQGKTIRKVIYVPGKIVSIVVD